MRPPRHSLAALGSWVGSAVFLLIVASFGFAFAFGPALHARAAPPSPDQRAISMDRAPAPSTSEASEQHAPPLEAPQNDLEEEDNPDDEARFIGSLPLAPAAPEFTNATVATTPVSWCLSYPHSPKPPPTA